MTSVYKHNNSIIIQDGKIGISQNCCCEQCFCENIANICYNIILTFDGGWGQNCINVPIEIGPLNQLTQCENGLFQIAGDLDLVTCENGVPTTACGGWTASLRLVDPQCNCETGEACEIVLDGWEPVGCPGLSSLVLQPCA